MAASKILLLLAVGLLIGGAIASFGAFKEFRRTSSQGQGGGRTEWALPVVLLDFVAAVLIIISQLSDGRGGAGFLWYVMMACSVLMTLAVASTIAVMWFLEVGVQEEKGGAVGAAAGSVGRSHSYCH